MRITRLFALLLTLAALTALSQPVRAANCKIMAGTTLIGDIVADLTAGQAEILTIIPGSSCPGHENIKTADMVFAAQASIVFLHSFQQKMPQVKNILDASGNGAIRLHVSAINGSWLVPQNQIRATSEIADALAQALPEQAAAINQRRDARIARVQGLADEVRKTLAPQRGKKVLAAAMQAEFVGWCGLDVVHTFDRAEHTSARELATIIAATKGQTMTGVVDNFQSGEDTGLPLALELRVPHVVLSNFPGSSPQVPDYFSLVRANAVILGSL